MELEHQLLGLMPHPADIEDADRVVQLAAHEDVSPQRLLVGERPLLVDRLDPELARLVHREVRSSLTLPVDLAAGSGWW